MGTEWYYVIDGEQQGPVDEDVLKEWVRQGRVGAKDLIWREGLADWQPAGDVFGSPAVPPPLPPRIAAPSPFPPPAVFLPPMPPPPMVAAPTAPLPPPRPVSIWSSDPMAPTPIGQTADAPMPAARPGGLTALAVVNFILGAMGAFFSLPALYHIVPFLDRASFGEGRFLLFVLMLLLRVLSATLLILSGVGYLKLKKRLGLRLGTIWAIISLATSGLNLALFSDLFHFSNFTGFHNFVAIVAWVYPVLTLILLHKIFKNAFVNP